MALRNFFSDPKTQTRTLVVLLIVSVVLRLGAAIYLGDTVVDMPGTADQISYHTLAQQILAGKGFTFPVDWWPATRAGEPTAHWSYLYTFYLVGVYTLFGVHALAARLIQAAMVGILHPLLIYWLGKRLFGARAGLLAAALTAGYIYFIYYAASLMSEPLYITAILAVLYFSVRLVSVQPGGDSKNQVWLAVGLGVCLGCALLLRQLFMLLIPFLFLWMLWVRGWKVFWRLALAGAVVAAMIAPFTIFNTMRFQRFVLLNTNAGYAFFWGNHPFHGTHFIPILPNEIYFELIPKDLLPLDEAALDTALLKKGLGFVVSDPLRYGLLSISRIPAYFTFWPSASSSTISNISRVGSFGLALPFMLAGLYLGLSRKDYTPQAITRIQWLALLLGFIVIYTGIHLLTWTLTRYRLPVDAVLLLFAGFALERLGNRLGWL
jgi:4-amino-4-deoxy-L-arabinose transferase-like glycosyltransferase